MIPTCIYCYRPMQLNTAMSTETQKQYVCGCRGYVYYHNVPNWKPSLELKGKRHGT